MTFSASARSQPMDGVFGTYSVRALVDAGNLPVVTGFHTHTVRPLPGGGVELVSWGIDGMEQILAADLVVNATGFPPDHTITSELRLDLHPILRSPRAPPPLIDARE